MKRTKFPSSVPLSKRHSRQTEEMQHSSHGRHCADWRKHPPNSSWERLLQFHCPSCHQPGEAPPSGVSPFPCRPTEHKVCQGKADSTLRPPWLPPGGRGDQRGHRIHISLPTESAQLSIPKSAQVSPFQTGSMRWVKGQITKTVPNRGFLLNQKPQKSCFPSHPPHQMGTPQLFPCSL